MLCVASSRIWGQDELTMMYDLYFGIQLYDLYFGIQLFLKPELRIGSERNLYHFRLLDMSKHVQSPTSPSLFLASCCLGFGKLLGKLCLLVFGSVLFLVGGCKNRSAFCYHTEGL